MEREYEYHYSRNRRKLKKNRLKKRLFSGGIALFTIGGMAIGLVTALNSVQAHDMDNAREAIVSYYGEDSKESELLRYIDVSTKLDELDLEKYNTSGVMDNFNLDVTISKPEEIESKVEEFKSISIADKTDLNSMYKYIDDVVYLKDQEQKINNYIKTEGRHTVLKDFSESLKKYAAEEYNLENPRNIEFRYHYEKNDGSNDNVIAYKESNKEYKTVINDKVVSSGVNDMVDLKYMDMNNSSNIDILKQYSKNLKKAIDYNNLVESQDLYNPELEGNLKSK